MILELTLQIVFSSAMGLLFYTYFGYPVLVYLLGKIFPKSVRKKDFEPMVTILITAYNEEKVIRSKLVNTLLIEYPPEKLEILVASDGSNDRTDEIVGEFAGRGVRIFHQPGRKGKTYTQNKAVEKANGEIILFSDATTDYQKDVLRRILPNFADQKVGCVAGKLIYLDKADSDVGKGARSYWNYETFIKESESRACSLIGASGCLYAVRRSAYQPMYPEACSDFLICTIIYQQGLRSVFEPAAVCTEETNQRTGEEMRMRVRVISQTFTDLWRNRSMMNPLKSGFYAVELISHKLLRYLVPLFLLLLLITSGLLAVSSLFFTGLFIVQILFYFQALTAWILEKRGFRLGLLAIPLYFVLTNFASAIGFYKFITGENYTTWEPIRETEKINT
jgi:cellulose synthase/poly-beta-1,6-N-acetylglucosamine synthase-like glycosyltransferase